MKLVVETTQNAVGCRLSHFSVNFWCPTLDTAALLNTSSFVLRFSPLSATCCGSETKLSGVLLPSTPMLCSTHSRWLSLFFDDVVNSSAMTRVPVGFLTETIRQVEATDRQQAGRNHTDMHTGTHTRSHTLQSAAKIPKWCSTTKNIPDDTMYIIPE